MYDLVCCSSATKNKRMTWLQAISETFFKFLLHHRAWKNIAKTGHKLSMKTTQGTQHVTIKVHGRWPRWVYSNYWKWRKLLRSWQNPTKLKRPKMRTFEDAAPFFVPLHPHPFSNLNTPFKKNMIYTPYQHPHQNHQKNNASQKTSKWAVIISPLSFGDQNCPVIFRDFSMPVP